MSTLSIYISELLFLHSGVIVPELGGFISRVHPAEIDEYKNLIYPPSKAIMFNNELIQNDGLLVSYVAHKQGVTYDDAYLLVSNQVKDLKHTLFTDGLFILNELGAFYLDENQDIQFRTDVEKNLLADSYGLYSIRLPLQMKYPMTNKIKDLATEQTTHAMNTRKKVLRIAAILIPIIAISVIFPFRDQILNRNSQTAGINDLGQNKIDSPKVEEIATKKKQALFYSEKEQVFHYHIIVGSYNKRKNAQVLVDQLVDVGNNAYIIEQDRKFRVSIQKFEDRYQALKKLDFMRNTENKEVWMLKTMEQ